MSTSTNAEGAELPVQPTELTDSVRGVLERMHSSPTDATRILGDWRKTNQFSTQSFVGATLRGLKLKRAGLRDLDLRRAVFEDCSLDGATFKGATLTSARFEGISGGTKVDFTDKKTDCRRVTFSNCKLQQGTFQGAQLQGAVFHNCDLREANFNGANLAYTKFLAVQFNRGTKFESPESVDKCQMERYALACLGDRHGELTEGNRMDMKIVDHVADLRLRFSGFRGWLHILSIATFFFPYAWFLVHQWGRASFATSGESITLLEALGRFIVNGGKRWQSGWHPDELAVGRFVLVVFYQAVRLRLLAKTKRLEAEQFVTGLPAKFSLDKPIPGGRLKLFGWPIGKGFRWRWALNIVNVFIYITLLLAILNAVHFLGMSIPISER